MNIRQMETYDRSAANKKYYEANKFQSHRSSLLNNVKSKGRVPFLKSVKHYNISILYTLSFMYQPLLQIYPALFKFSLNYLAFLPVLLFDP